MSIYLTKKQNMANTAKNFFYRTKEEAYKAKYTAGVMAWTAMDINARMNAGHQRAFGQKKR